VLVGLLVGCGSGQPEPRRPRSLEPIEDDLPATSSAEWLFATSASGGDRQRECKDVGKLLLGEAACQGASCEHASRLANDWLEQCRKQAPSSAADIEQLQADFELRAEKPKSACGEELDRMLATGCREDKDCEAHAQDWATRCSATDGTPLVLLMLQKTLEQTMSEPHRVRLDPRSCDQLAKEVRDASRCSKQFDCEDVIPRIDLFRSRCRKPDSPPLPPADGLAQLTILLLAGRDPGPMVVAPTPEQLGEDAGALRLQSGQGAILQVCGHRVADLSGYLGARAGCQDGELVVAHLFPDPKLGRTWRVGTFAHPNDAILLRRFPSLLVTGELAAREAATKAAFTAALDEAAGLAVDAALARFVQTLTAYRRWVVSSKTFAQALTDHDAALTPLLTALAQKKLQLAGPRLRPPMLVAFAERGQNLPLADVDTTGEVAVGAITPVAALDLEPLLPRAVAAYRAGLEKLRKKASQQRVSKRDLEPLATELGEQATACGSAWQRLTAAEQAAVACSFGTTACGEGEAQKLGEAIDRAQRESDNAYARAALARASLSPDDRAAAGSVLKSAGCLDPTW
jgi:hypothetical protein